MKLHKKLLIMFSVLLVAFTLVACGTTLTKLTLEGISNIEVEFDAEFNVLTNVKAIGDDKKDYTDKIVLKTTSSAIDVNTGVLNTKSTGEHKVRYDVVVGKVEIQEWRTITVKTPPKGEGLLQNGDFSQGDAHWTIDQGQATVTVADGVMEIDVVAGGDAYQPRMHQMGIPFENGKTYEVKYEAKASVEKTINLQVGELLEADPWFTDFKPKQIETADLTTEWQTFSYKFTHKLDNINGGVLFELGTVNGKKVDGIVYFKNITIAETTAGEDVLAPTFEGLKNRKFEVGTAFDPLAGVTAYDIVDGDLTNAIEVAIYDENEAVVSKIDVDVVATYKLVYTVVDAAGNEAEETITVSFEAMKFADENLIINGDFSNELGEEWKTYLANWDGGPNANATIELVDGTLVTNVIHAGDSEWNVQLFQEGIALAEGKTYRLTFTVSSEHDRSINVRFGETNPENEEEFWNYADAQLGLELTATPRTVELIFTMDKDSNNGKFVLEMGKFGETLAGNVILHNVILQERFVKELIDSDFENEKHVVEQAGETTHATSERTKDALTITLVSIGDQPYVPHYFYIVDDLLAGTYTFKITVTGDVARTLRFNIVLPDDGHRSILNGGSEDFDIEQDEAYEYEVTFTIDSVLSNVKIELDFGTIPAEGAINATGTFVLEKISLEKK